MDLEEILAQVNSLAIKNKWYEKDSSRPQTPRNLAISISLEASELLECFQWSETANNECVGDEIADVIIYCVQLSNVLKMDISSIIQKKIKANSQRIWK
ncbi:MazG-like family protein [Solidesulfovibrio carbinolicus]|uniref:Nucleotide pyrophosphohydrolase n=1 Tax=Solidesulfovibrio carbinolicus TaxID=296842 RepID=A0A4P6HI58_9BACT|nr:MazG-like family protein [Solidesulfovibrio carbinolicus]QAZ66044.1 nucleotide pyrophosphohydrolase [Solidesulfovibrio carbinolicus]